MNSYERYVDELLKLQRCYRLQNILTNDIVSKIDLISRPRVALTFAVALWVVSRIKQGSFSYSDIVYIQRRLAQFLMSGDRNDINIVKRLFDLIPMRYGMNISLAARRCGISEALLSDMVKAFNIVRDVIDIISSSSSINEPLRHTTSICLNDADILPPTTANPKEYLDLTIKSLKENLEAISDPLYRQVAEIICEETAIITLNPSDQAAIALIIKLIAETVKPGILCVDPCINVAILSQKLLNDLAAIGAIPYDSKFYRLYQEISARSVVHSSKAD